MNEAYFIRKRAVNLLYTLQDFLSTHNELKKNTKFKNIHKGQRCFILGSGPSILTNDLTHLKNEIVMTQNNFHTHKDIKTISPEYHVVIPKFHPKEHDKDWVT